VRYRAVVPSSPTSEAEQAKKAPAEKQGGSAGRVASPTRPTEPKQPITVLTDRVMVQVTPSEGERRSRAGILIPATAQVSRRLTWAEAVAVGPNVRAVKPGDKVLYNPEDRYEVEVQGEEYVILRERDVHAVASERLDGSTGLYL
jgi:chaperonin GroES